MSSLQKQVEEICNLADYVIKNPKEPIVNIAQSKNMLPSTINAVSSGISLSGAFSKGFGLSAMKLVKPNPLLFPITIVGTVGYKIYDWIKQEKRKKEEKERMLREIIAKQQAIIRELEKRLEGNRIEIENLKEMLRILKETEQGIRNTA